MALEGFQWHLQNALPTASQDSAQGQLGAPQAKLHAQRTAGSLSASSKLHTSLAQSALPCSQQGLRSHVASTLSPQCAVPWGWRLTGHTNSHTHLLPELVPGTKSHVCDPVFLHKESEQLVSVWGGMHGAPLSIRAAARHKVATGGGWTHTAKQGSRASTPARNCLKVLWCGSDSPQVHFVKIHKNKQTKKSPTN